MFVLQQCKNTYDYSVNAILSYNARHMTVVSSFWSLHIILPYYRELILDIIQSKETPNSGMKLDINLLWLSKNTNKITYCIFIRTWDNLSKESDEIIFYGQMWNRQCWPHLMVELIWIVIKGRRMKCVGHHEGLVPVESNGTAFNGNWYNWIRSPRC